MALKTEICDLPFLFNPGNGENQVIRDVGAHTPPTDPGRRYGSNLQANAAL